MYADDKKSAAKKSAVAICILYLIVGASQHIGTSYISLFIKSFPFIGSAALGYIMAGQYIMGAAGQFLWGNLADKSKTKNRILVIVLLGVFAMTWVLILPEHKSGFSLVACVIVLNLFLLVPLSLIDTIVVENKKNTHSRFGNLRGFASAGSALGSLALFAAAKLTNVTIDVKFGLGVMAFAALAAIIPLSVVPKTAGHAYGKKSTRIQEIKILMKNRRFLLLLLFGLCNFSCTGAYVTYYATYFTTAEGLGGGLDLLNLYSTLCIGGEAVMVILSSKLFAKKDIYWIFTWVCVMGACRAISPFIAPNAYFLLFCSIFQGLMFGPLWGRVAPFIGTLVHDEVKATAQAIWAIVYQGLGPALGAVLSGIATKFVGMRGVFCVVACAHLLNAVIFFIPFRRQRLLDVKEHVVSTES